jgi:hypothetical protein
MRFHDAHDGQRTVMRVCWAGVAVIAAITVGDAKSSFTYRSMSWPQGFTPVVGIAILEATEGR